MLMQNALTHFRAYYIPAGNDMQSASCDMWLTFAEQLYVRFTCMTNLSSVAHAGLCPDAPMDRARDAVHEKSGHFSLAASWEQPLRSARETKVSATKTEGSNSILVILV